MTDQCVASPFSTHFVHGSDPSTVVIEVAHDPSGQHIRRGRTVARMEIGWAEIDKLSECAAAIKLTMDGFMLLAAQAPKEEGPEAFLEKLLRGLPRTE